LIRVLSGIKVRPKLIRHSAPLEAMPEPKLLDQVRQAARLKHFSLRTERSYVQWVYRFVMHHGKRHPREMGARRNVAASTQNQALSALLFLYREVLRIDLPRIEEAVRARRSRRLPTVPTREEVRAVITHSNHSPVVLVRTFSFHRISPWAEVCW